MVSESGYGVKQLNHQTSVRIDITEMGWMAAIGKAKSWVQQGKQTINRLQHKRNVSSSITAYMDDEGMLSPVTCMGGWAGGGGNKVDKHGYCCT